MSVAFLIVTIVVLLIAVFVFLKKPKTYDGISANEVEKLKTDNNQLQIGLAKAEERAAGLALERDKADKVLQDERIRYDAAIAALKQELNTEKSRIVKAEEAFKAQRERLADHGKIHPGNSTEIPARISKYCE